MIDVKNLNKIIVTLSITVATTMTKETVTFIHDEALKTYGQCFCYHHPIEYNIYLETPIKPRLSNETFNCTIFGCTGSFHLLSTLPIQMRSLRI